MPVLSLEDFPEWQHDAIRIAGEGSVSKVEMVMFIPSVQRHSG